MCDWVRYDQKCPYPVCMFAHSKREQETALAKKRSENKNKGPVNVVKTNTMAAAGRVNNPEDWDSVFASSRKDE